MNIENSETHSALQIGDDAARQAARIGQVDIRGLGATARSDALGGSALPVEVFAAGLLAVFGGALGGSTAFHSGLSVGLGIVVGAGVALVAGVVLTVVRAPNRAKRQQDRLRAAEAARADESAKRIAAAQESGAFDRFGKDR